MTTPGASASTTQERWGHERDRGSTDKRREDGRDPQPADVLVIFGITGDLAKVMTFRSLYRLEQRGLLDCPIVGVAVDDWTIDQLIERARESIVGTGEQLDEDVFDALRDAALVRPRRLRRRRRPTPRVGEAIEGARRPVFYLEIPPFLFGTVVEGLAEAGLTKNARVVVEKPFGHDLDSARALADELHQYIDESQLLRIDHYLGKMGLEEILYLRFANTMLEPVWNRNYVASRADHDGRGLRRRGPRPLLRPGRRAARRRRQPPHAGRRGMRAMEAPAGGDPETSRTRRSRSSARSATPTPPTTSAASTTATSTSTASRPTRRPRRTPRSGSTSRTGAGRASRSSSAPASGSPSPRPSSGSSSSTRRGSASRAFDRRPEPNQLVIKLDPSTGVRLVLEAHRADRRAPAPIELDMEFAAGGRRGADAVRGAAPRRDGRRQHALHAPGRRRGDVADHAAAARRAAAGARRTRPGRGARRTPTSSSPDTAAGTGPGSRHERRADDSERAPQSAAAPSPFPPIADYAFLSNCHTGALVAPDGAIDWLCVPRFDSPSVFGSLLDRQAGFFRFGPFGINHPSARAYEPGTNVLVTTWKTPAGWIVVRDALTMGPRDHEDAITPHTRPPADDDADHMLVRTVECLDGQVEVELVCEPAFDYGRAPAEWTLVDDEPARGRRDRSRADDPTRSPTSRSASRATASAARHVLRAGRAGLLRALVGGGARRARRTSTRPRRGSRRRSASGARWLSRARIPDHRCRDPIQRSALAIKGLTYMPTGATVAALTTSLPETPGGERNWDYRYTWMRDTTFTLQALHWLNLDWEADEFMQFVADVEATEDGSLQIMYGIDGRRDLTESTLDHLSGYAGRAARADRQRRLRPAPERRLRRGPRLDPAPHPAEPAAAAPAVADRRVAGRVRDEGLARARPGHLGGARQAAALRLLQADVLGRARPGGASWPRSAAIRQGAGDLAGDGRRDPRATSSSTASATTACCASTTRRTRSTPRCSWPRSSTSCPATTSACTRPSSAIADELTENGFVLRYRTDETDDGLSGKEGTFLICSFWLVSALAIVGELQQARDLMERLLRIASPLGLYAEEFDADTGRHLGNFPQAFSHLALMEAAARIIVPEMLDQY